MGKVLLLEDDPDLAEAMVVLIGLAGHEVGRTASGRQAVLQASRGGWDLCVVDIDVEELSGLGAQRALSDFSDVPVLVVSGSSGHWQREAFAAGATACLRKPFAVPKLLGLVQTLVGRYVSHTDDVERLSAEDIDQVAALTPGQLDELPYGVIELNAAGVIVAFNAYESSAIDRAAPSVLGRRFIEVAPCVQVKSLAGPIESAFTTRALDEVLRLVFPSYGALAVVSVRLYFDPRLARMWIFVSRRAQTKELARGVEAASADAVPLSLK